MQAPHNQELIAKRYEVLGQLGRGGMALVYEVHDRITQRKVALKQLHDRDAAGGQLAQLFEREYYMLSQLVHPRIIEIYDYQASERNPFYTMELLSGGDLRDLAPLDYQTACRLLCDVCSALALLHSRRLVHRDLTPLNIRCTLDGRAKLFDFGAMTGFGRSRQVVGTPPFVAPEALHGQYLDGQTDLFALGATLYFALTGQHAYPARSLAELPEHWQHPPAALSLYSENIPPALDELCQALLQLEARARPPSAADVMERLSALGGFELEDNVVRDAYLRTPVLVGRDAQLGHVQRAVRRSLGGSGGSIVVCGAQGAGRSRLLDACALDAQVQGALVLRADADDASGQRWSAVCALLHQIRETEPELAELVLQPRAAVLGPLLRAEPRSSARPVALLADDPAPAAEPTTSRAAIQTALQQVMLELARGRPLFLVLDDVERFDEPSIAMLALLANQAREQPLLMLAALNTRGTDHALQGIQLLQSVSERLHLDNLNGQQTQQLVTSLFGEDPHVHWLADRIQSVSTGNPAQVIRVASYLVQQGLCHYASGAWVLPPSLPPDLLTQAVHETIDPGLAGSALDLARAIALSEIERVPAERCQALAAHDDPRRLQADLLSLSAAGIVTQDAASVRLSRPSWATQLLTDLAAPQRQLLHLRVAAFLEAEGGSRFRIVQHLLAGGETARAFDMLRAEQQRVRPRHVADPALTFEYTQSLPHDWTQTFRTLIFAGPKLGRPRRDVLLLQLSLLGLGATTARIEREMSLDVAVALSRDAGLDLIAELTGQVPESELLSKALTAAQHRFAETPEHERGLPLVEAIQALAQVIIQSIAGAARAFDLEWLEALPALTPLTPLAPALTIVQRNLESSIDILRGRTEQAYAGYCELSERLSANEVAGLTPTHLKHMRSAVTFALGLIEANAGQPRALTRADVLSSEPLFALSALRLRAIYALARGDRHAAEAHRAQTELLQIQNAPPQLLEGTQALQWTMGYALIADLVRVRQCLNDVEALARELHGWQPVVHYARGTYHALRGDRIRALDEYERALALTQPGRHIVWGWTAGAYIWELTRQERYAEAQERGAAFLAQLERCQMLFNAHAVRIPYALALGLRGEMNRAIEHLTIAERRLTSDGARGVQLGTVYEVRAQLALAQRDQEGFQRHAAAFQEELRLGNHSALAARHTRLLRAARKAGLLASQSTEGAEAELDVEDGQGVATLFEATREPAQRAELALQMLIDAVGASGGRLYLTQAEGHLLSAQLGAAANLEPTDDLVQRFVLDSLRERQTTVTDASTASQAQVAGQALLPLLLCHSEPDAFVVTGVAVLAKSELGYTTPQRLLNALSRRFQQYGDCTPRRARSNVRSDARTGD